MMNFPDTPLDGQSYTNSAGLTYYYSAPKNVWTLVRQSIQMLPLTGGQMTGQIKGDAANAAADELPKLSQILGLAASDGEADAAALANKFLTPANLAALITGNGKLIDQLGFTFTDHSGLAGVNGAGLDFKAYELRQKASKLVIYCGMLDAKDANGQASFTYPTPYKTVLARTVTPLFRKTDVTMLDKVSSDNVVSTDLLTKLVIISRQTGNTMGGANHVTKGDHYSVFFTMGLIA